MALFDKFDPEKDVRFFGLAEADDLGASLADLLKARQRAFMRSMRALRTAAIECCCEAKATIKNLDLGDVAILGIGDEVLEINDVLPTTLKWDTHHHAGAGFSISTVPGTLGRVAVTQAGWYRIYALATYDSIVANVSIKISATVNGIILPGAGRHGLIMAATGHDSASSSVETWSEMAVNDYIDILTVQNGAPGAVHPIAGESMLIVERRPYPITGGGV